MRTTFGWNVIAANDAHQKSVPMYMENWIGAMFFNPLVKKNLIFSRTFLQ